MNRAVRRKLRRHAAEIAREAAEGVVLEGDDGGLAKVRHEEARAILRREIARSLRQGGDPVIRRLTEAEASTFPHIRDPRPDGSEPWLAVALAMDGRMAVTVRRLKSIGPGNPDAIVRGVLVSALASIAISGQVPGLGRPAGRA